MITLRNSICFFLLLLAVAVPSFILLIKYVGEKNLYFFDTVIYEQYLNNLKKRDRDQTPLNIGDCNLISMGGNEENRLIFIYVERVESLSESLPLIECYNEIDNILSLEIKFIDGSFFRYQTSKFGFVPNSYGIAGWPKKNMLESIIFFFYCDDMISANLWSQFGEDLNVKINVGGRVYKSIVTFYPIRFKDESSLFFKSYFKYLEIFARCYAKVIQQFWRESYDSNLSETMLTALFFEKWKRYTTFLFDYEIDCISDENQ